VASEVLPLPGAPVTRITRGLMPLAP
jgi:hypothetical protein